MSSNQRVNGYNIKPSNNEWYVENSPVRKYFRWKADAIAYANSLPTLYAYMLPSGVCLYLTEEQAKDHPLAKQFC